MTYLWWAIRSGIIRIGRWFEREYGRREASLFHDWDTELTEAEAERENWEPGELVEPLSASTVKLFRIVTTRR